MKKRTWLTVLFLFTLLSISIIVRIYYVNYLMAEVRIDEKIYNAAKVSIDSNGLKYAFAGGFQMQALYIYNLYLAFLIFGNFTVAGVYLNIFYQLLTVLLAFIMIKNLTNRYIALAGSLILAIIPVYLNILSEVTIQNMIICIAVLIGTILISSMRWIYRRFTAKKGVSTEIVSVKQEAALDDSKETSDINCNILPDTSMKEIRYDDLEDNRVRYIENPLPVPKRREHKEMDYAFEPAKGNDDYDLNDLTGKDFYDIE